MAILQVKCLSESNEYTNVKYIIYISNGLELSKYITYGASVMIDQRTSNN